MNIDPDAAEIQRLKDESYKDMREILDKVYMDGETPTTMSIDGLFFLSVPPTGPRRSWRPSSSRRELPPPTRRWRASFPR